MLDGEVARRNGEGVLLNFGLVAGDNARASNCLLLGILIGCALIFLPFKAKRREVMEDRFGLGGGTVKGLEQGETGTRVSELVAVLKV